MFFINLFNDCIDKNFKWLLKIKLNEFDIYIINIHTFGTIFLESI